MMDSQSNEQTPQIGQAPAEAPPIGFAWVVAHAWHGFWLYAGLVMLLFFLPLGWRFLGNDAEVLVVFGLPILYLFAIGTTFRRSKRKACWIFVGTLLALIILAGLPGFLASQRGH